MMRMVTMADVAAARAEREREAEAERRAWRRFEKAGEILVVVACILPAAWFAAGVIYGVAKWLGM